MMKMILQGIGMALLLALVCARCCEVNASIDGIWPSRSTIDD